MELLAKIISKQQTKGDQRFNTYVLFTSKGQWYQPFGLDKKTMDDIDREVKVFNVSRKFTKTVRNIKGDLRHVECLKIDGYREPTDEEVVEYNKNMMEFNSKSLEGVE